MATISTSMGDVQSEIKANLKVSDDLLDKLLLRNVLNQDAVEKIKVTKICRVDAIRSSFFSNFLISFYRRNSAYRAHYDISETKIFKSEVCKLIAVFRH